MSKDDAKEWCNNNNAKCKIEESYSDDVEKNNFISQNIDKDKTIYKSRQIIIVYSLGAKPSEEFTKALKKAEIYSKTLNMSKQAIYDQLTSSYGEKFTAEEAQYAIDNLEE